MCLTPNMVNGRPLPCGHCEECCAAYSAEWSQRCMDELELNHGVGCFLTLTYNDEHLPSDRQLVPEDLQKFLKRLRRRIEPVKLRFFACGEYGGRSNRPHYHLLLFGWRPDDYAGFSSSGQFYSSKLISELWPFGFHHIGDITLKSCKYCAKYLQKLDPRCHAVPPFTRMSLKPGLGRDCVTATMAMTGTRYFAGKPMFLPRYYLKQLEAAGLNVDMIKGVRAAIASKSIDRDLNAFNDASRSKLGLDSMVAKTYPYPSSNDI